MADEPSSALGRRASFAADFIGGTTNLAQRRRYQEDIQAASNEDYDMQERQFKSANRRAELADPLKARQVQSAEQRILQQGSQFKQNLTLREKQAALAESRFALEEKKADYAIRKSIREQTTADRILSNTDAVEQADFDLRQNGFLPGSQPYAAGIVSAIAANPYINADYRRTLMQTAQIEDDPDEVAANIASGMTKPAVTAFVSPEGKKRYTVREAVTESDADPIRRKRELIKDLKSANQQVLYSASNPKMKEFWNKEIQKTQEELLKLDSAETAAPAPQAETPSNLIPRKASDGTIWLFDPATKQAVRRAE